MKTAFKTTADEHSYFNMKSVIKEVPEQDMNLVIFL